MIHHLIRIYVSELHHVYYPESEVQQDDQELPTRQEVVVLLNTRQDLIELVLQHVRGLDVITELTRFHQMQDREELSHHSDHLHQIESENRVGVV
jgi:hypothetical protein